ncbi:hypothetical protein LGT39_03970 [Demequina sp. TTPB684]|uniref:hypothetical protein n=1 Tax=unclassified Demequina TaxID=2620311 RepID=UPI001CF21191|nr:MULTISPECIES: hypothetical protein [unclassified Demequina]MCB2412005.1 hypothetical protein [Demequina sp. TTPB684]UPU88076.1 hypothetical protein LGT36_012630 [Demequina sp. TMPB413]
MGESQLRATLRWLAHPVSLVAIGVLVLNDHVLKAAYGTWWTGKLSDVAGLVFFPALVAVALAAVARVLRRPEVRQLDLAAVAITGVGFVWVKATWAGAATASAVLSAIAGPSVVRADVTDLLALPALGLAAWVAGRSRTQGSARRARLKNSVTVAVVPLALLASVATSASDDPHANVVVDNEGVTQAYVSGVNEHYETVRFTYENGTWHGVGIESVRAEDYGYGIPIPNQTEDCVPSDPSECFRAMTGATGVERSADGGATWDVDWQLTPDQLEQLEHAYGKAPSDFVTNGVGVVATNTGFVVIAGNGTDGFAVRDAKGAWERVGFEGMPCCAWAKTAELGTVDTLTEVHAFPVWLLLGVGLAALAVPFVGIALRHKHEFAAPISLTAGEWVLYGFGALFGFIIIGANSNYGPLTRRPVSSDAFMMLPGGATVLALIVIVVATAGLLKPWRRAATIWGWVLGAIAAGAASALVPGGIWLQSAAAVAALVAVYAAYVPWARRRLVGSQARRVRAGAPTWTQDDAAALRGVGHGSEPTPPHQVFARAGYPQPGYPTTAQLEVSLGRLVASGLVRFAGVGQFRATREGRRLIQHGSRGEEDAVPHELDATLAALREVPCRDGRVRISGELYDQAVSL